MTNCKRKTVAGFVGKEYPAFLIQYWPNNTPRGHVIYLPPFLEEMNRCRSIAGQQARWFADQGLTCSVLDYYGTGESPGDLAEASLWKWHKNIDNLIDCLLSSVEAPIYLWGCRLGGLIALDYVRQNPGRADKLLLWQPVTLGRAHVTQMLRQRSASLIARRAQTETTAEMRRKLLSGQSLEVAGYVLGGELVKALDAIDVEAFNSIKVKTIFWLEYAGDDKSTMSELSQRTIEALRGWGANVEVRQFRGHPLWQLHKRDSSEDLLQQTQELKI